VYPSYRSYNQFSNIGFGGLNYFYGPVGGYTPFVTPYGYTTYGYPHFGPYYSYVPLAPVLRQRRPFWIGGDPFNNGQGNIGQGAVDPPAVVDPPPPPRRLPVPAAQKATSPDVLRRSIRLQHIGDEYFAKQNYMQAFGNYKQALSVAPSRIEARFRMALALAATTHYGQAVDEMKRAMRAAPDWPRTGAKLDDLFGEDNNISKNAVLHKVAAWVREDIRDPDRLFLMGVLLHFDDEPDKSHTFFEAAAALAPNPAYAQAFLDAEDADPRPGSIDAPAADDDFALPPLPRGKQPAGQPGPRIPGLQDDPAEPVFRGKKPAAEEPRPRPLARGNVPSSSPRSGAGT
jgi:tetratricopeptide (TPR) repeat protein